MAIAVTGMWFRILGPARAEARRLREHEPCYFDRLAPTPSHFLLPVVGIAIVHCSAGSTATGDDGGVRPLCPSNPPATGSACALEEGTVCDQYATSAAGCECCGGGGAVYACRSGRWRQESVAFVAPPAEMACPATVPNEGESCTVRPCSGAMPACSYDCVSGRGSVSTATCNGGRWTVSRLASPCPRDGGTDASDGRADAAGGG